jgi:molybdopterin/thiamine biosynthesis adenylyltransferase
LKGEGRYSRQVALFGVEGQEHISRTRVGIVGLGGLGSHVAQQLAFLGVSEFLLIDGDRVSVSNLNRLIGATDKDVGTSKVSVARGMVSTIQPAASVDETAVYFDLAQPPVGLERADVLFGCVDSDVVRLQLVRYASAHSRPYIDLASDVEPSGEFGGRVVFAKDGERCLSCLGELDQEDLARAQMTPEQRAALDEIYGVDRAVLGDAGPSVVSINGLIASLAVTEFFVWRSGLRPPHTFLTYRGDRGMVGTRADPPREYCHYCMTLWGSGKIEDSS